MLPSFASLLGARSLGPNPRPWPSWRVAATPRSCRGCWRTTHRVAPLIAAQLAGSPIVYQNFPDGLEGKGHFGVTDEPLTANALLHAVHAKFAIEFYTWAPLPKDLDRLRFARILLEPDAPAPGTAPLPFPRIREAALAMRDILQRDGLKAVPLLDGGNGVALWMPLADAPHALPLRTWLHVVCNEAAIAYPELVTTEPNTHRDGRVHLHVSSDAPHRFSAVPYSLRPPALTVHAGDLGRARRDRERGRVRRPRYAGAARGRR